MDGGGGCVHVKRYGILKTEGTCFLGRRVAALVNMPWGRAGSASGWCDCRKLGLQLRSGDLSACGLLTSCLFAVDMVSMSCPALQLSLDPCLQVWASKWNDRAWLSRRARGVAEGDLFMSCLLQQVSPRASANATVTYGVAFPNARHMASCPSHVVVHQHKLVLLLGPPIWHCQQASQVLHMGLAERSFVRQAVPRAC